MRRKRRIFSSSQCQGNLAALAGAKQKPRAEALGFRNCAIRAIDQSARVKFEVDACANDVLGIFDRGARAEAIGSTGRVAEIDIEIFGFGGPVRRKGEFKSGAGGPADLGGGLKRSAIETGLHRIE